jgi:single-strand DNA-binding protein
MNKLTIIGNLTKDPELRTTTNGTSVCSFTVAVNRKRNQQNGQPEADYFNVTAWRELGENCAKYLTKGRKVAVIGPVSVRVWESNGKHGANMEMTADEVEFLSPRESQTQSKQEETPVVDKQAGFEQVTTDDLPF